VQQDAKKTTLLALNKHDKNTSSEKAYMDVKTNILPTVTGSRLSTIQNRHSSFEF